jgi:PAS domain S-box-containing protein
MVSTLLSRLWAWIALALPIPIIVWSALISLSAARLERELQSHIEFNANVRQIRLSVLHLEDAILDMLDGGQSGLVECRAFFENYRKKQRLLTPAHLARLRFPPQMYRLEDNVGRMMKLVEGLPASASPEDRRITRVHVRRETKVTLAVLEGWIERGVDAATGIRHELGMRWSSLNLLVLVASVMALLVVILMYSYRISVAARRRAEFERDRFFTSSLDMQFIADFDGRFKQLNRAWERTLGFPIRQLAATAFIELVHPDDRRATLEQTERVRVGGDIVRFENRCRTRQGAYRWMLWTATPDIERKLIYGTMRDVTERREAQMELARFADRLAQSNQELQDFASVASHDLQEPLNKVMTFGERLETHAGASLDEQSRDYLLRIRKSAQRMKSLIVALLELSRVTSRARAFERVDLHKLVDEVLSDLEIRIEQSRARIEVGDLPTIDADPIQIAQLFQNLIGNALKFHRPGTPPQIRVESEWVDSDGAQRVRLTVTDDGIGFNEAELDTMFAVFQRPRGQDDYEGTGVGLAVCRKIAQRHRGTIRAEVPGPRGARFVVDLPVRQDKLEPTPEPGTVSRGSGGF